MISGLPSWTALQVEPVHVQPLSLAGGSTVAAFALVDRVYVAIETEHAQQRHPGAAVRVEQTALRRLHCALLGAGACASRGVRKARKDRERDAHSLGGSRGGMLAAVVELAGRAVESALRRSLPRATRSADDFDFILSSPRRPSVERQAAFARWHVHTRDRRERGLWGGHGLVTVWSRLVTASDSGESLLHRGTCESSMDRSKGCLGVSRHCAARRWPQRA